MATPPPAGRVEPPRRPRLRPRLRGIETQRYEPTQVAGVSGVVAVALASLGGVTLLVSGTSSPSVAGALFVLLSLPPAAICAVVGIRLFASPHTSRLMRLLVIANLLIVLAAIVTVAYVLWLFIDRALLLFEYFWFNPSPV